ncbi:hypothetical protein NCS55_00430200 [Fusarium keratoplasticum]|nr:hypothetical protein NCS55_00430200 [Fusarium keratoplasticum]
MMYRQQEKRVRIAQSDDWPKRVTMEAGDNGENSSHGVQSMVTVLFSGSKKILLPENAINKHPKLASRFVTVQNGKQLDLTTWWTPVVHVFVMFLFTGTYQDLQDLKEIELYQDYEDEAMLSRVLETYLLANEYGLERLVKLAVHEFGKTSVDMSLSSILRVVCKTSITFDSQHPELMNTLIPRASRTDLEEDLDEGLEAFHSALKNDGTTYGAIFSQILEQRARIRELMLENQRLTGRLN